MNPKKMRKLLRDPKLFFKDMLHKRLPKKSNTVPTLVKKKGNYSYSVVAAVYGVEKYLDDFFKSLVNQSLDFKSHIQLIMVDDGSLDGSAEIVKKWQKKYPDNIVYLKKENGGQASARNLGMNYASGEWISFIDPDDFVDAEYFFEVDKHISRQKKELLFVSCNFIFFHEDKNQFSDSHPLNYRFKKEELVEVNDGNVFHQLTVNSVFFNAITLQESGVRFHEDIKPNFEDGDFVSRILLKSKHSWISFLPSAKYFYRKRSDGTSTLDNSFFDERRYTQLIENGYLRLLLIFNENNGSIPKWLQSTILYDLVWMVKSVLNNGHNLVFMDENLKALYINNLRKIASFIDDQTILEFSLAGCWLFHKVGILGFLKNSKPDFSMVYADSWDESKKLLCIKYFWHSELPSEDIFIGGNKIFPIFEKNRKHDFLGREFVCERIIWVSVPQAEDNFIVEIDGKLSRISLRGKQFKSGVSCNKLLEILALPVFDPKKVSALAKPLRDKALNFQTRKIYKNAWIFMDRDTMADDNAEHLYRYVRNNHPEINAFFVLRKASPHWKRLAKEGFNMLDFDSEEHRLATVNAKLIISSHADGYVMNPLPIKDYGDIIDFKHVFLQHGVTKDNLSKWLNSKPIDFFVTATHDEYESIVSDFNQYKFSGKEVVLTGFPRHDSLLKLNEIRPECKRRNIVIMPTWRNNLMGEQLGTPNQRAINKDFFDSLYAVSWKSLLHSEKLKNISERLNANIIFYPHANIDLYIEGFDVPKYIEVKRGSDAESMQGTFVETDVLITDYSSVAFEVAYLKKPVIYYQFDRDEFFSGAHTYQKGYFDYDLNGFGPVCLELEEVVSNLEKYLLQPDCEIWKNYQRIADETFAFRDGKCCERTYEAIKRLQEPVVMSKEEQVNRLRLAATEAEQKNFIQTAIKYYQQCFELTDEEEYVRPLIVLLSKDKQYDRVLELYEAYGQQWSVDTITQCLDTFVALGCYRYVKEVLDRNPDDEALLDYSESLLKYAASNKNTQMFDEIKKSLKPVRKQSMDILSHYLQRDWDGLRASMQFASCESSLDHFDLFLQACFRTHCVAYAEQVFEAISGRLQPAVAKNFATRIKIGLGDFDGAIVDYESIAQSSVESLCGEDIDNWMKLRQYKKIKALISPVIGIKLLNRFLDDPEISDLIVKHTDFKESESFNSLVDIFSDSPDSASPAISLFIFKSLISQNRFDRANDFVLHAESAASDVSDFALIADFKKINVR
ncbi:CDP-glycerol:glycerophosphate glycerophosphotransferase [Comamonas sp.]